MTVAIAVGVAVVVGAVVRRARRRRGVLGQLLPPPRDVPVALAPKGGWLL